MEGGTKIADAFKECQDLFKNLASEFHIPSDLLHDQPGRLRLWAGNIGAHQRGRRSSLDYRLRNAPHLGEAVLGCLEDIRNGLSDVIDDMLDPEAPSDCSSDADRGSEDGASRPGGESSPDLPPSSTTARLNSLAFVIKHIDRLLDCLFDLSITIRNPATRGLRPLRYSSIDVSAYWSYDLEHLRHKLLAFTETEGSQTHHLSQALIERLARGNLERRQYFTYQTHHHEKLQEEIDENATESQSQTIATEYVEEGTFEGDYASSYAPSEASCVSVVDGQQKLAFPPLPKDAADHKYFECPYCYELLAITTTLEWRKHLLLDLRPYVCVFDDCMQTGTLFSTRREWFAHECNLHWNYWSCSNCQQLFSSLSAFEEHMRRIHSISVAEYHKRGLSKVCRRTKDKTSSVLCEICGTTTTLKDRVRHMGRHMEDIALFTLGTWEQDENENENDDGVSDEEEEEQENEGVGGNANQNESGNDGANTAVSEADERNAQTSETFNVGNSQRSGPQGQMDQSRMNEYFIEGEGILREVIQTDICRYLGNHALVRPGVHGGISGYYIRAYRNLTSMMIRDLKADSARWEAECERRSQTGQTGVARGSYLNAETGPH